MRIPHRCPVCDGRGTVPEGFYTGLPGTGRDPCKPCSGTGVLWGERGSVIRIDRPLRPADMPPLPHPPHRIYPMVPNPISPTVPTPGDAPEITCEGSD